MLLPEPLFPGVLIDIRPIGMFQMEDEAGGDDKVICMPADDPRKAHIRELEHIGEHTRLEIQHFFEVYKELEPGKSVEGAHWTGRVEAEQTYHEAIERARSQGFTTARWRGPAQESH